MDEKEIREGYALLGLTESHRNHLLKNVPPEATFERLPFLTNPVTGSDKDANLEQDTKRCEIRECTGPD